jgi:hypothetical protein
MDLRFDDLLAENQDLYLFENEEGRAIFRLLPYNKYSAVKYILNAYPSFSTTIEEDIWQDCVVEHTFLSGASTDNIKAGTVSAVATAIMRQSCATEPGQANQELEEAREYLQDSVQQAIIFICEAFPSYLPENLERLTWKKILKRLAQAELILNKNFQFQSVNSQPQDDSSKIMKELNKLSEDTVVDNIVSSAVNFNEDNQQFHSEEWGAPKGNFNIRERGR